MNFLIQNKWIILLVLEILAWTATFFMLYARYRLQSKLWFKVGTVLFALTGVIPQVLLGVINYVSAGEIDLFTICIVVLIVYGATIGKRHIQKIDDWAKKRFQPAANEDNQNS